MKRFLIIVFLFMAIFTSCTDIIDTEERDSAAFLVVEGDINNLDEPYLVKLSTNATTTGIGSNELGRGAEVIIRAQNGGEITLTEVEPGGLYSSVGQSFGGQIGEFYQLYIKLANGEEYESSFEQIRPPVELLDVFAELRSEPSNDIFGEKFFHDISVEVANNTETTEFFSIDLNGVAEVKIEYNGSLTLGPEDPCLPEEMSPTLCYAIREPVDNDIIIGTNAGVPNSSYILDVFSVPADFELRYLAKVRTNTISEQAFQYLNSIKEQLDKEGSIFDSPFPALVGNIRNIRTGNRAQGFFFASAVSENQVCFDRSVLNFEFSVPIICALDGPENCIEFWSPATIQAPEGFELCL